MRKNQGVLVGAAVVGLVWAGVSAFQPQDEQPGMPEMSPEQMAEMEAWMKAGTPGEQHKWLAGMIGEWDCDLEFRHGPDEEFEAGKGTSVSEWVLDGRIVKSEFASEFMGMPFQGLGFNGYDNVKGEFFSIWMDSMTTGFVSDSGHANDDGTEIEYHGGYTDPMGNKIKTRNVVRDIDENKTIFEMYQSKNGGDMYMHGRIVYNRK